MSRLSYIVIILAVILSLAIIGGLAWANMSFLRTQPLEKNFLVPWSAARTFVQYGDSPYSLQATQRAQVIYYGRQASAGQDPLHLWIPLPFELFFFPFALIGDYVLARSVWMAFLEIALIALGGLSIRLSVLKPARSLLAFLLLFSIFWVYGTDSLVAASVGAYAALGLVGFLLAIRGDHDELGGALLLLSLCVPSLTGLLVFFLIWWVFYRRRWRVLWGFLMALVILVALSFLLIPGWLLPYLYGLVSYFRFSAMASSVSIFASWSPVLGSRLGWLLAALLLLLLFVEWGAALRNDFRHLLWTVNLTLVTMPFMGIPTCHAGYVLFIIPLFLVLGILFQLKAKQPLWGAPGIVAMAVFFILWAVVLLMAVNGTNQAANQFLFLLMPLALFISLYWMRWRFTRSPVPELVAAK